MFISAKEVVNDSKHAHWRVFSQFSENLFLMCKTVDGNMQYAPLYIHTFRLIAPRKLLEAELFNQQYNNYEEIDNVPDRLRWCRHHMGLMQKEVAEQIGITREHYIDFETGCVDYYPREIVDKLAAFYGIPVGDLLDDYNRFLYEGQGKLLRKYRENLGITRNAFAEMIGIHSEMLRTWETDQKRMLKASWEKYFKGIIEV